MATKKKSTKTAAKKATAKKTKKIFKCGGCGKKNPGHNVRTCPGR